MGILGSIAGGPIGAAALNTVIPGGGMLAGLAGSILPGLGSLLGGGVSNQILGDTAGGIKDLTRFDPQGFAGAGGFGIGENGNVTLGAAQSGLQNQLTGASGAGLGGGLFNDPNFAAAFGQNDIAGALGGAQQGLLQQMGNSAFGGIGGINAQANQLGGLFGGLAGQGLQDQTGAMSALFGGGLSNLAGAGNISGLVQQNLDASNALAAPGENALINNFANREFSATRGATTGSANRQFDMQNSLLQAQNQRVLNAQGLGLQAQQQQGQLGLGQVGVGLGALGANQAGLGQNIDAAQGFGGLGLGSESLGFGQALSALQQNQSSGNQRLQNAMGLFGLGSDVQNTGFGQGIAGQGALTDINSLMSQLFLGQQNAAANRIGATGLHAGALADVGINQAGAAGGLLSSLFGGG